MILRKDTNNKSAHHKVVPLIAVRNNSRYSIFLLDVAISRSLQHSWNVQILTLTHKHIWVLQLISLFTFFLCNSHQTYRTSTASSMIWSIRITLGLSQRLPICILIWKFPIHRSYYGWVKSTRGMCTYYSFNLSMNRRESSDPVCVSCHKLIEFFITSHLQTYGLDRAF